MVSAPWVTLFGREEKDAVRISVKEPLGLTRDWQIRRSMDGLLLVLVWSRNLGKSTILTLSGNTLQHGFVGKCG